VCLTLNYHLDLEVTLVKHAHCTTSYDTLHVDQVILKCHQPFKAAVLRLLKKIKDKKKKLTVNTGPLIFSGEIYYTDPLIQLTKWLVFCIIYCVTDAVAVK